MAAPDRLSPEDLLQLSYEPVPGTAQIGGLLRLGGRPGDPDPGAAAIRDALAGRVVAVPRLRQRLHRVPLGYGRPVWADDPSFDLNRHLGTVTCPPPGDEPAVLRLVAATVTRPLPADRPLWSATVVDGLAGGGTALLIVLHHVVADGLGGLAVLGSLVDAAAATTGPGTDDGFPRPAPTRRELRQDAARSRREALAGLLRLPARLRAAAGELPPGAARTLPRTSLLRPAVGLRRGLLVVRTDLAAVRAAAHRHGGTVNDAVLAAIAGALGAVAAGRGERLDEVVVSMPVSGRDAAQASGLGNRVGVMPVAVPTGGDPGRRLERVAARTRSRKAAPRGASVALLGPLFRGLAALRLVGPFINHQRMVHTFVTDVAGPPVALSLAGAPVRDLVAVPALAGNVTVSFGVLSYAGRLAVTLVTDPDRVPDADRLASLLDAELAALVGRFT
jgi:diacylglycerol O-acyltransferase